MQASARLSSTAAAFRKVIVGVSTATTRSCYRTSRGKAHAAPLPAPEPPQKLQKRISMQERRAKIIEFVENYRASNDGKFPTMRNTRQQVGGCQYTVTGVLKEMKYKHAKLALDNSKAGLQKTVKVTERPRPKDEARVAENQGILEVSDHSMPKDDAEVAQLLGTDQVSDHSFPKDEAADVPVLSGQTESERMKEDNPDIRNQQREIETNKFNLKNSENTLEARVAENQGILEVSEHSFPKDEGKVARCQGAVQFTDLSCGKTANHDMDTAADAPASSNQTECERMKEDNPDLGDQQREIEANKFDLKNSEKALNANDSNGSDQSEREMVNEAKMHAREDNPKLEESMNTGLLGSLKSFAYGIRNFWKNM